MATSVDLDRPPGDQEDIGEFFRNLREPIVEYIRIPRKYPLFDLRGLIANKGKSGIYV